MIIYLLLILFYSFTINALDKDVGHQAILDLYNCKAKKIDDIEWVEEQLYIAAIKAKGTIVESKFHKFSPYGISGMIIIEESHIAIHTWPEYEYAAIDIFSCSSELGLNAACDHLIKAFEATDNKTNIFTRGKK
jgi:S-adenosylmethionine decarboxylase proenzyme